jgi:hypothetical protein
MDRYEQKTANVKRRKKRGYHRKPAHAKEKKISKAKASNVTSSSGINENSLQV